MKMIASFLCGILGFVLCGVFAVLVAHFGNPEAFPLFSGKVFLIGGISGGVTCAAIVLLWPHRHRDNLLIVNGDTQRCRIWWIAEETDECYAVESGSERMVFWKKDAGVFFTGPFCRCVVDDRIACPSAKAGKADCGCWYHAEDGIPCPHDGELK